MKFPEVWHLGMVGAILLGGAMAQASAAAPLTKTSTKTFPTTVAETLPTTFTKTAEEIPLEDMRTAPAFTPATTPLPGSVSEIVEADGTTVILPPDYDEGRTYPALVLMPYTDRTALHMFNWGIYEAYQQRTQDSFIVILPPGQGSSANWSGPGWEAFVNQYDTYVREDLLPIASKYNVDLEQLVVGGFSLGGDLSWTLSLRNPEIFSGAIVMGSMSTYRDDLSASQLADRDFRYFMVMGGYDGNWSAMQSALDTLDAHAITYHYEEVGSAGHGDLPEQMQRDLFLVAMDYVLEESNIEGRHTEEVDTEEIDAADR